MNYCGIDPHANNCVVIVSDDEDRSTPVSGRLRVGCRCPFRVVKRLSRRSFTFRSIFR